MSTIFNTQTIQNPNNQAPKEITSTLCLVAVEHTGFDGQSHKGQIIIHQELVDDMRLFFDEALRISFPIESVIPIHDSRFLWDDERSCAANNTSAFNYRSISGKPGLISKHGLGRAFDVNPRQNIYIRYDEQGKESFRFPPDAAYDVSAPGTLTPTHPLVLLMKERGWEWGGDWTPESGRVDWQHFEHP